MRILIYDSAKSQLNLRAPMLETDFGNWFAASKHIQELLEEYGPQIIVVITVESEEPNAHQTNKRSAGAT